MKDKVWQKYENAKRKHVKVELTADTESIYSAAILWLFAISGLSRDQKHIYAQILVLLVLLNKLMYYDHGIYYG